MNENTNPSTEAGTDAGTEGWKLAGEGWSHAATDWAYLFEPHARDSVECVLTEVGTGPGTELLDVACGAGLAVGRAARMGANVAGIDAASGLLEIAAKRAPAATLVHGDMFELPWNNDTFDAAVSFNGIFGGGDQAVAEIARVTRPGARIGISYWGDPTRLDLLGYFMAVGDSGPGVDDEIVSLASINAPGEAERMLTESGFTSLRKGTTTSVLEFPDADIAWRTLRSPGLVVPSLEHVGEVELRQRVLAAIEEHRSADGSYRLTNELVHIIGTRT